MVAALAACGGEDGPTPDGDAAVTLTWVAAETVTATTARAGQALSVSCLLIDAQGEAHTPGPELSSTLRFAPETAVRAGPDGAQIALRAGRLEVGCAFPGPGLLDDSPAVVEVLAGAPARLVTHLEPSSITAGEATEARCEVLDAFDNRIEGAVPSVRSTPSDEANGFDGTTGSFERAGRYEVSCELPGVETSGVLLEVRPSLPASLYVARVPEQPFYAIGQVVGLERLVRDRFGNAVPSAVVPVVSDPEGEPLGEGRFRYAADGRYRLTATVEPPTEEDRPLSASTEVIVDSSRPSIRCESPLDGSILDTAPGSRVPFRATANAPGGVRELRVNGAPLSPDAQGTVTTTLTMEYGLNLVEVVALDVSDQETSRTCSFLVADRWAPDDDTFLDSRSLRLRGAVFDDQSRVGPIDSFADVLHAVLNSRGLRDQLHAALLASNPLKPSSCDRYVLRACVLRSEIIYRDVQIDGPNSVRLVPVNGGLRLDVRVENLRIRARLRGQVSGVPYDTTGWVTYESAVVSVVLDVGVAGGRPRVSTRPGTANVTMGRVSTSFSGVGGAVIDLTVVVFQGQVQTLIANMVRHFVTDELGAVLGDLLASVDLGSLGPFPLSRLDSDATIPLSLGLDTSSVDTTAARMLLGLGTRVWTPPVHARPTLGAPVRGVVQALDADGAAAAAVHELVLTQALHALWRGGFFDATLDSSLLPNVAEPAEVRLVAGLPPVARLRPDGRVEISLGAVQVTSSYPQLFAEPIQLALAARASASVELTGRAWTAADLRIEVLHFSAELAPLDADARDPVSELLGRALEVTLGGALARGLGVLPVPSFELPASLTPYGLPAGARLGPVSSDLLIETPHFVERGSFGIR